MGKRALGILLLLVTAGFAAHAQDSTDSTQTKDAASTQTAQPAPTPYAFPDKGERFRRYLKSTVGPLRLGRAAVSAGLGQWSDSPEEWGQGVQGYSKRFASSMGSNAIHQTVEYGLDEALHLDSSFTRSNHDGFLPRLKDALIQNVTSRTTTGKQVVSVPRLAGYYAGGIVPKVTWYPDRYSYKDGIRSGTKSLFIGFGVNVFREFVWNW